MTATEAYELTTQGGATDFAQVITACQRFGPYCLIGGLAVNCYVEPVYTLDADLVLVAANLPACASALEAQGYCMESHLHFLNAQAPGSELRIQFSTDQRYQTFLSRAIDAIVLGISVKIACLEDVAQGKLWAYSDLSRRLTKRKKDELDLLRIAEAYPVVRAILPDQLVKLL